MDQVMSRLPVTLVHQGSPTRSLGEEDPLRFWRTAEDDDRPQDEAEKAPTSDELNAEVARQLDSIQKDIEIQRASAEGLLSDTSGQDHQAAGTQGIAVEPVAGESAIASTTAFDAQPTASPSRRPNPFNRPPRPAPRSMELPPPQPTSLAVPFVNFELPVKVRLNRFPGVPLVEPRQHGKTLGRAVDLIAWDFLHELVKDDDGSRDFRLLSQTGDEEWHATRISLSRVDLQEPLFYPSSEEDDDEDDIADERTPPHSGPPAPADDVKTRTDRKQRDSHSASGAGRGLPSGTGAAWTSPKPKVKPFVATPTGPRSMSSHRSPRKTPVSPSRPPPPAPGPNVARQLVEPSASAIPALSSVDWAEEEDDRLKRHASRFVVQSANPGSSLSRSAFVRQFAAQDFPARSFINVSTRFTQHVAELDRQYRESLAVAMPAEERVKADAPAPMAQEEEHSHKKKEPKRKMGPELESQSKASEQGSRSHAKVARTGPSSAERGLEGLPNDKGPRQDQEDRGHRAIAAPSTAHRSAPAPPKVVAKGKVPDQASAGAGASRARAEPGRPPPSREVIDLCSSSPEPEVVAASTSFRHPGPSTAASRTAKGKEREIPRGPRNRLATSHSPPPAYYAPPLSQQTSQPPSTLMHSGSLSASNTVPVSRRWGGGGLSASPEATTRTLPFINPGMRQGASWNTITPFVDYRANAAQSRAETSFHPRLAPAHPSLPLDLSPLPLPLAATTSTSYQPYQQDQSDLQIPVEGLGQTEAALLDRIIESLGCDRPDFPLPPIEAILPTIALLRSTSRPIPLLTPEQLYLMPPVAADPRHYNLPPPLAPPPPPTMLPDARALALTQFLAQVQRPRVE